MLRPLPIQQLITSRGVARVVEHREPTVHSVSQSVTRLKQAIVLKALPHLYV